MVLIPREREKIEKKKKKIGGIKQSLNSETGVFQGKDIGPPNSHYLQGTESYSFKKEELPVSLPEDIDLSKSGNPLDNPLHGNIHHVENGNESFERNRYT